MKNFLNMKGYFLITIRQVCNIDFGMLKTDKRYNTISSGSTRQYFLYQSSWLFCLFVWSDFIQESLSEHFCSVFYNAFLGEQSVFTLPCCWLKSNTQTGFMWLFTHIKVRRGMLDSLHVCFVNGQFQPLRNSEEQMGFESLLSSSITWKHYPYHSALKTYLLLNESITMLKWYILLKWRI